MEGSAVCVALHEEDALFAQLELVVRVAVLVLRETGSLYQPSPSGTRQAVLYRPVQPTNGGSRYPMAARIWSRPYSYRRTASRAASSGTPPDRAFSWPPVQALRLAQ